MTQLDVPPSLTSPDRAAAAEQLYEKCTALARNLWWSWHPEVINLFRELRAAGATVQDIDELRRLAADVRASDFSGNPDLLDEESRLALSLVEQMELALSRATHKNNVSVRTNATDEVPDEHKETVADYYRKLGQADDTSDQ